MRAEVKAGAVNRATQDPHHGLLLQRGGRVRVALPQVGPSHRVVLGAAVTLLQGRYTVVLPIKVQKYGPPGNQKTASTSPRSHTNLVAGAPLVLEAGHESGQTILENTRRKVITIEIKDGSAQGHMSAQAIAMSGTILDTADIGGEMGSLVAALGPSLLGTPWLQWPCSVMFFGSVFNWTLR